MLNSVGERTSLCVTSVLNWRCLDVWFLLLLCRLCDELNKCAWNVCL